MHLAPSHMAVSCGRVLQCFDKCGVFVKPSKINVGDFPAIVDPDEEL